MPESAGTSAQAWAGCRGPLLGPAVTCVPCMFTQACTSYISGPQIGLPCLQISHLMEHILLHDTANQCVLSADDRHYQRAAMLIALVMQFSEGAEVLRHCKRNRFLQLLRAESAPGECQHGTGCRPGGCGWPGRQSWTWAPCSKRPRCPEPPRSTLCFRPGHALHPHPLVTPYR